MTSPCVSSSAARSPGRRQAAATRRNDPRGLCRRRPRPDIHLHPEATMAEKLFPTTVVGSYPQPDWLVDRKMLSKVVPRVRMKEMWRVADEWLEQAQDDATIVAIRAMERAGIDVITDGEMRRESYSNRFAT